jgi:hypothetical protein
MTVSIDTVNEVLGRMDAMIERIKGLDKILIRFILDSSNSLTQESRYLGQSCEQRRWT